MNTNTAAANLPRMIALSIQAGIPVPYDELRALGLLQDAPRTTCHYPQRDLIDTLIELAPIGADPITWH